MRSSPASTRVRVSAIALALSAISCGASSDDTGVKAAADADSNSGAEPAAASGAGTTASAGATGSPAAGSMGFVAAGGSVATFDPRESFPEQLGSVSGVESQSSEGCCTRQAGAPVSMSCPPGSDSTSYGVFHSAGDTVGLSGTLNTRGVDFRVTALAPPAAEEVVALTETTLSPPKGVLDVSPVFHVGSEGQLPAMAVQVPVTTSDGQYYSTTMAMYFSADGSSFEAAEDSYVNAGFLQGTIQQGGFVMAGVTLPSGCQ